MRGWSVSSTRSVVSVVAAVAVISGAGATSAAASSGPDPFVADGNCVIDPARPEITVDSLRYHCTTEQSDALFSAAQPGAAPEGKKRFWVLPAVVVAGQPIAYPLGRAWAAAEGILGDALTFDNGPTGQPMVRKNYAFGMSPGGPLLPGISYSDGKPAWTVDFSNDTAGVPVSSHEFREIAPDVWLGRSYLLQKWNPLPGSPVHGSYVITS
ncbi:hypothetical protein [Rhodococcus sp. BH5]|uniref:hypothetical protein n=1 Tax=Rhodococcus sp. BH5 TaxID=2871702 RepID=UPI0022CD2C3B|nr:hypothetical protein [Rhodococcus sp. BH5]MCZ9635366.1 hypothetical protein [Rhodococcus sp. BH5]